MNKLSLLLTLLLTLSVGLNIVLWKKLPSTASQSAQDQIAQTQSLHSKQFSDPENRTVAQPSNQDIDLSADKENLSYPHREQLDQAKALLRSGEFDALRRLLQSHLRQYPQDIEFLLVEADLIQQTESVSYALEHYYELLEYALNASQQAQVLGKIANLVDEHAKRLSNISAWDILATFAEPLWQKEPNKRDYILILAEAYAHLALVGPTENVLAALMPEDPDAIRIRAILPGAETLPSETPEPIAAEEYRRAVALSRIGDQFVVESNLSGRRIELLIDTGATTTVLSESAFNQNFPERLRKNSVFIGVYQVNTAGGKVDASVYRFPWLAVGGLAVRDTAIIVMPTLDFARADGLLGMNFLREFDFRIDQQKAILYLD